MRSVAESLSVEVEDTGVDCLLVEEGTEAAVAAVQDHYSALDSDGIHLRRVEDSRSLAAVLVDVFAQR